MLALSGSPANGLEKHLRVDLRLTIALELLSAEGQPEDLGYGRGP